MIEKLKKNMNEWHYHSLAITILAITTILQYEEFVLSIILIAISTVLNGIGALYNQNKKQSERLETILSNQKIIISELLNKVNDDRKYEYKKDGASIMLNKAELLNIFMKEEKDTKWKII